MGYTAIAQTPVVTGLYTLVLPAIAFAILGSSRHLVVAADSATAAVLAAALVGVAAPYSPQYVSLAASLALVCAGMLVLTRLFRLGFLADFLSRSALAGFLTGVGIQVAAGEAGALLGITKQGHGTIQVLGNALVHVGDARPWTVLVAASVLAIVLVLGRVAPRFPGALVAVVAAIVASAAFHLQRFGVETIGNVPSGLPRFTLPDLQWHTLSSLVPAALSCVVIIIAQSAATSRSYALRFSEALDENRDLDGLAAANVAASLTGTFVVNGSPTKTEMVDMAGGRSQVAQLTTAAIIVLVLLFLTRQLSYMPAVVLSAVVFLIGVRLVDVRGLRDLYRLRRREFWIAAVTCLTVAFVGVEQGVVLAIVISLVDHLRVSYRPPTRLLTLSAGGGVAESPVSSRAMALPGLMIYRFEAPIYYANADYFMTEALSLTATPGAPVRWFLVRFDSISDVDYSGSKMLLELASRLRDRNVTMAFTDVKDDDRALLQRYGIIAKVGAENVFVHFPDAINAYEAHHPG